MDQTMNDIIPIDGGDLEPVDPPRRPTRKRARKDADHSGALLGLVRVKPGDMEEIAKLGVHVERTGPANIARGTFQMSLDEAKQQLESVKAKLARFGDGEGQEKNTQENSFERMSLLRLQTDAIKLMRELGHSIMRSGPDESVTVETTKSVQSFPANSPIPPMSVTETLTVKATGTTGGE